MDIMEMVNGEGDAFSTYHWLAPAAPKCSFPENHSHVYSRTGLAKGWNATLHEFAVERGSSHIAFAVDGVSTMRAARRSRGALAPSHHQRCGLLCRLWLSTPPAPTHQRAGQCYGMCPSI